ncbi:MAG: hypothetical protein HC919_12910 [Oscillatoriales cyanobacterium SM2_2_1]|nr:hypothetical protein [Oscillatoriales cyanobacterium SM2_2_1]
MATALIATIGTRDLAFQLSSGEWLNVGNDRAEAFDVTTQAGQVALDLATDPNIQGDPGQTFRDRTRFFAQNFDRYGDRLLPIILGKLIADVAPNLKQIYFIATDQQNTNELRDFRNKDTCYAAKTIALWTHERYPYIPIQIVRIGEGGEDLSDFDAMVRWTKEGLWYPHRPVLKNIDRLLISPKGGVNQLAEAMRVTALTTFANHDVQFCNFTEDKAANQRGEASPYSLSDGKNYLWDLTQQQALKFLERYDFEGAQDLLEPYLRQPVGQALPKIKVLLQAAIRWNTAEFAKFRESLRDAKRAGTYKGDLTLLDRWDGQAYESAYLAWVRYGQGNLIEAFFNAYRAVEGLMADWAIVTYPQDIDRDRQTLVAKPSLQQKFSDFPTTGQNGKPTQLYGKTLDTLFTKACPDRAQNVHLQVFRETARDRRNTFFHRLQGISEQDLFGAWEATSCESWIERVLGCLNAISGRNETDIARTSAMAAIYEVLCQAVTDYHP